MERLLFEFVVKAAKDGKTNMLTITSISTEDNRCFTLPEGLQPASLHTAVIQTKNFTRVKNTLTKRHQHRKVWIALTQEIKDTYIDEERNILFQDYILEEITGQARLPDESLTAVPGKTEQQKKHNLKHISEKFVMEKFTEEKGNVQQWLDTFEKECIRFEIVEDAEKIEIFRLFLEKSCLDWYSSMLLKSTLQSTWREWKESFEETYGNKGWSPIRYAFAFRYRTGSLLAYAVKKERLLLETRKDINTGTIIDAIVVGLPVDIADRINRDSIQRTQDLFKKIGKLEHLTAKRTSDKPSATNYESKSKSEKQSHCKNCERLNKGKRYHAESTCWFRQNENKNEERRYIKNVNNTELEVELNNKTKLAWTTIAHECTKRYNETEHTITGFAPAYLLEGKNVSVLPEELRQQGTNYNLHQDRKTALKNSIKSHDYNKEQFDKNRKIYEFKVGDFVFIENGNRLNRKKLDELKIGPFEIIKKISNSIYEINTGHKRTQSNFYHITKLLPVPKGDIIDEGKDT